MRGLGSGLGSGFGTGFGTGLGTGLGGGLGNGSFGPKTLAVLEAAFDEAWLTLKLNGNDKVRPDELARCILRLATEGELDRERLHDRALSALAPATTWRQAASNELQNLTETPA
jgi:hypothetical protein